MQEAVEGIKDEIRLKRFAEGKRDAQRVRELSTCVHVRRCVCAWSLTVPMDIPPTHGAGQANHQLQEGEAAGGGAARLQGQGARDSGAALGQARRRGAGTFMYMMCMDGADDLPSFACLVW